MTRYRVFYEDEAAAEIKEFGAHLLLCACVADRMGNKTLWDVRRDLDGQPKKGDSKLLAACRLHAARDVDEVVFAVFDTDQLQRNGTTNATWSCARPPPPAVRSANASPRRFLPSPRWSMRWLMF